MGSLPYFIIKVIVCIDIGVGILISQKWFSRSLCNSRNLFVDLGRSLYKTVGISYGQLGESGKIDLFVQPETEIFFLNVFPQKFSRESLGERLIEFVFINRINDFRISERGIFGIRLLYVKRGESGKPTMTMNNIGYPTEFFTVSITPRTKNMLRSSLSSKSFPSSSTRTFFRWK